MAANTEEVDIDNVLVTHAKQALRAIIMRRESLCICYELLRTLSHDIVHLSSLFPFC